MVSGHSLNDRVDLSESKRMLFRLSLTLEDKDED